MSAVTEESELPSVSMLDRRFIEAAYFRDAYRASLNRAETGITEIFQAIFAHHPSYMKIALIIRHRIVSLFGIQAPSTSEVLHPQFKSHYSVGENIGVWPILALSEDEIIVGRNHKHLDFRLSMLKTTQEGRASVIVSTVCVVHNVFGKIYLFFVSPFHKWGVKRIIANAMEAGRL